MEFKKLQILKKPIQKSEVNVTEFWENFKSPTVLKENGQISNLHFGPSNSGQLAVTSGCKVSIYNTSTNSLVKSISRFTDLAYSGTIRNDGKLLLAGDASGVVQIFDLSSRSILRTFKGHNGSVPCTKFMPDFQQILTASYDKTVKIWDVPSQSAIITFEGHEDYIKTAAVNPSNHSQIISGSYDHCIKLWDVRSGQCTSTINHQAPIESIEVFGNGGMVAVGGGPSIQIYDLISGKSLITLDNFQKSVTSVKLTSDNGFLMGGSLDRYVKCYDTSDWSLCNSVKFPGMVSSIDISNDNTHMVVGMTTGIFSIQTNKIQKIQNTPQLPKVEKEFGSSKLKRKYEDIPSTENVVEIEKDPRQSKYYQFDHLLRKFKYKEALDAALKTHDPSLGFGVISELIRRGGLIGAISGRDDISLQPLISYLARNLRNHVNKALIIDVAQLVMELYGDVIWKSKHLDLHLRRLMTSIYNEKKLVQNLIQFQGKLGLVLSKINSGNSNVS